MSDPQGQEKVWANVDGSLYYVARDWNLWIAQIHPCNITDWFAMWLIDRQPLINEEFMSIYDEAVRYSTIQNALIPLYLSENAASPPHNGHWFIDNKTNILIYRAFTERGTFWPMYRADLDPTMASYLIVHQSDLNTNQWMRLQGYTTPLGRRECLRSYFGDEATEWVRGNNPPVAHADESPPAEISEMSQRRQRRQTPDPIGRGPNDKRWSIYPSNYDRGDLWIYYTPIEDDLFMVPVYCPYHLRGIPALRVTALSRVLMNDQAVLSAEAEAKLLELDAGISRAAFPCGYLCIEVRAEDTDAAGTATEATSGPQDKPEAMQRKQRKPAGWSMITMYDKPCIAYTNDVGVEWPAFFAYEDPLLADYLLQIQMTFPGAAERVFCDLSFHSGYKLKYLRRLVGYPEDRPMESSDEDPRVHRPEAAQDAPEWTQSHDGYMLWRNTFIFHASNDLALARWLLENQPDSTWMESLDPPFDVDGLICDIRVRLAWPVGQGTPSYLWEMDERGLSLCYTYGGETVKIQADKNHAITAWILEDQPFVSLHDLRMLRNITGHATRAQTLVTLLGAQVQYVYKGLDAEINHGYKEAPVPRRRLAVSFSYDAEAADITAALFKLAAGMADRVSISTVTFDDD